MASNETIGMSQRRLSMIREVDFRLVEDRFQYPSGIPGGLSDEQRTARSGNANAPRDEKGRLLTRKQIRARARRKARRVKAKHDILSAQEQEILYRKPVSEWDMEELARGRPRNVHGTFSGMAPSWVTREFHERAMEQFRSVVRNEMNVHTITALDAFQYVLGNTDVDERGKPMVSASTKLEAAKFLLEHTVGKPTQRIESDVSVKLQGILGQVMVSPDEVAITTAGGTRGYNVGHLPGVTMPMATGDDIIDAEVEEDEDA